MTRQTQNAGSRQAGFSMVELLVAVAILIIIMGSVMGQVTAIHKRSQAESSKLDIIQEAREGMDQLTRDLHQAGYPNRVMYDSTLLTAANWYNDQRVAIRLVAISPTTIWFEGDVDGRGQVSVVRYRRVTASAESQRCTNATPCIERMQSLKITADPLVGQPNGPYHILVENVTNFTITAYDQSGNQIALGAGLTMTANPQLLYGTVPTPANPVIKTIAATLTVQSPNADLASKLRPSASVSTIVELKN